MEKFIQWLRQPRVWGFIASVAIMAVISIAFFYPDNFEGNSLRQLDMQQGAANGREAAEYLEQTGEQALWTNALFGGMPTFQISPSYPSNSLFTWLNEVYGLGLPAPSNLLFMMMMGFFILLYVMNFSWYYALIGAVAWGFSSYFIIIIGAGHIWKFVTLSYIPPTIAGLVLCYRGRYVAGAALTALFAMLQLNANHPQMSYYFAFVMFALAMAWLVESIRQGQIRRWLTASAVVLVAGALAVGANLPSLYNTYEYSKETKRSQSELTPLPSSDEESGTADRPTGGLPRHEIVGWSYGQAETFSLLVPNIKGGATARPEQGGMVYMGLDRLPEARQYEGKAPAALLPYMPQYFNGSEGTNGPVYVGAIICALFLLGCIIVKGPVKWALVVMTVLSVLLSWGANFDVLTDLFIYHFPMYNKFRAVESILVIAEFTMPLLALMALHRLFTASDRKVFARPVLISFGICAVVAAAAWLAPGMWGDAITAADRAQAQQIAGQVTQMAQQYGYSPAEIQAVAYQYSISNPENAAAITALRHGLVTADAMRSLIFVLLGGALLWCACRGMLKSTLAIGGVGVLVLIDLYGADKRYVSHDSFVAVDASSPEFTPDAIDATIMQDTSYYRVMDVPGFWKADRSYFHHMVGGYHAAKLNRYEDLIQRILNPAVQLGYMPELRDDSVRASYPAQQQALADRLAAAYRVLDMLNARYIITGEADAPVLVNTRALGPAWLVPSVRYVENADAEMAALASLDPRREAVADKRFADMLGNTAVSLAPGDTISLVSYTPNRMVYVSDTRTAATAVFSEIWFPWGWKAAVDGQPAELARVNYVLRAMHVPAGRHEITMTFDPDSIHVTGGIAYACVTVIYILLLLALFIQWRRELSRHGAEPLV
ncbi:MAG: hypothetical protein K2L77_03520 [Muribaculaceae bacterium]|nr:hypothetical protein [Muribaculaceae bacterium]